MYSGEILVHAKNSKNKQIGRVQQAFGRERGDELVRETPKEEAFLRPKTVQSFEDPEECSKPRKPRLFTLNSEILPNLQHLPSKTKRKKEKGV